MHDANLIAFGAAVTFTAFVGGYVYVRGTIKGLKPRRRSQPISDELRHRPHEHAQVSSSSSGSL
jgi:hypothetical protein